MKKLINEKEGFDAKGTWEHTAGLKRTVLWSLIRGSSGSAEVKPCPHHLDSGNKVSQKMASVPCP